MTFFLFFLLGFYLSGFFFTCIAMAVAAKITPPAEISPFINLLGAALVWPYTLYRGIRGIGQ